MTKNTAAAIAAKSAFESYLELHAYHPKPSLEPTEITEFEAMQSERDEWLAVLSECSPTGKSERRSAIIGDMEGAISVEAFKAAREALTKFDLSRREAEIACKRRLQIISAKTAEKLLPILQREREKLVAHVELVRAIDLSSVGLSAENLLARSTREVELIDGLISVAQGVSQGNRSGNYDPRRLVGHLATLTDIPKRNTVPSAVLDGS